MILSIHGKNVRAGANRFKIRCKYLSPSEDIYETNDSIDAIITYLNESEHIVCGEFDKAILCNEKDKDDTITLTDGWFDVKYGIIK